MAKDADKRVYPTKPDSAVNRPTPPPKKLKLGATPYGSPTGLDPSRFWGWQEDTPDMLDYDDSPLARLYGILMGRKAQMVGPSASRQRSPFDDTRYYIPDSRSALNPHIQLPPSANRTSFQTFLGG